MNKTFKKKVIVIVVAFNIFLCNCNQLYKAGNLIYLGYPIETPLKSSIIRAYIDSLTFKHGFGVPEKWLHYDKLVDLDSVYNKRIYFRSSPEEMYLICFGGQLVIGDIYNPLIQEGDWVSRRESISKEEESRIRFRFQTEVLDRIEKMAKRAHVPDSLIYK